MHADGFRAERGRPHALALPPNGNPRRLQRLAGAHNADLMRLDGPDTLLAHYRDFGRSLAEGVVAQLVRNESLAAGRRERRTGRMRTSGVKRGPSSLCLMAEPLSLDPAGMVSSRARGNGCAFPAI